MWEIFDENDRTLYVIKDPFVAMAIVAILRRNHWVGCYGSDMRSYNL